MMNLGFPVHSVHQESAAMQEIACSTGGLGSILQSGRYPEEGNAYPLQSSCLENPRDGKPGGLPSMGSHRVGHD